MSEDEENLIPVTWIKQYHFCPKIIYYVAVLGYKEKPTETMKEGKEHHTKEDKKAQRRTTLSGERKEPVTRHWSKLPATSKTLGIYGIIDEVAETQHGLTLIENKYTKAPRKPYPGHIYQAAAYAMLAEEKLGKPIKKIKINYLKDKKSIEIPLTEQIRKHVKWTINKIKEIIEKEKPPPTRQTTKCHNCGYKKICQP